MGGDDNKDKGDGIRDPRTFLRQIVDINPNLIFVKDRQGRFTLVNQAIAEVYGTSVDNIVGKTDADFNPNPEEVEWFRRDDLQVMDSLEEKFIPEEVITDARGNRRYLQTIKRPLVDADGVARHVLGVATDVTKLKLAEEARRDMQAQILHAQKLESLGVLAGGIAHDFNNLMVGVMGNAEIALTNLSGNPALTPLIERISTAATRAAELCNQLLAYSGRGQFVRQPLNLSTIVEEMNELLSISISKKATLLQELRDDLPDINVDPTQARQVIMNLITNASDALGDEPGTIKVRTGTLECDQEFLSQSQASDNAQPGLFCFVEVTDSGVGMDDEILHKMFDPFFSTKFAGRGLGLAAVLGIVSGHGGAIRYCSQKGKGTQALVFFPQIIVPSSAPAPAPKPQLPTKRAGTALIVDDEALVRDVLGGILATTDMQCVVASGGMEGVAQVRARLSSLSIVLLDLTMPDMSGTEVLREIRRLSPTLPVVLMSGYSEEETLQSLARDPHVNFIQKPFRSSDLLSAIDRLLSRE